MEKTIGGKYRLLSRIQGGGFGMTWLALDTTLDMQVAVKEYTNADEKQKKRFLEEARSLAKFAGEPGIVNVRDFLEEDGNVYLIMEYLDGKDLKTYIEEEGALSFAQACRMLRPVMLVLDKLHQNGMIHRDVSPENIRILSNGQLKLLDFGSALDIDREYTDEKTMTVMVKLGYAPQEQNMDKSMQGAWTDVYAICATLYKCVTGKTPVDSLHRGLSDVLEKPSELGCGISAEQEAVLMRGMALRREDRFASMTELIGQLDQVLQEKPERPEMEAPLEGTGSGQAERKKAAKRSSRPAKKKGSGKGKIAAVLLGVVVVVLGIVAAVLTNASPADDSYSADDSYWERDGSTASISDMEVNEKMIAQIAKDWQVKTLQFWNCTLGAEEMEAISAMKNITWIYFYKCKGDLDLSPLAKMERLETLWITGDYEEQPDSSKGEQLFTTDFPQVTSLQIEGLTFGDAGESLGHFRNLESLRLTDTQGLVEMGFLKDMQELQALSMVRQDLSSASESLAYCTKLRYGYFNGCEMKELSWTSSCKGLENLYIKQCGVIDISSLAVCQELWMLEADGNQIQDISALAGCGKLKFLDLTDNQIQDISALSGCSKLQSLDLADNQIRDISALQNCSGLSEAVFDRNQIESLEGLEGKEKLKTLQASQNKIADLTPLSGCTSMEVLELKGNQLTSLDGCEGMMRLKSMSAADNQLTDASGLANDTSLKTLDLSNNQLSGDLGWMKNFTELETVNIGRNQLSSLQGIENNTKMKMLAAEQNQITDVTPLAQMASLQAVCLNHNQITSMDGLGGKGSLTALLAADNRITDISALETSLAQLLYLDLGSNEISDISVCSGLSGREKVLLLENNQITDISKLPQDIKYRALTLYGNPIEDFSRLQGIKEVSFLGAKWYFPYGDGLRTEYFSNYLIDNLYFVDVPAEEKSRVLREMEATGRKGTGTLTFQTKEEADEELEGFREEIYGTVLGKD